MIMSLNYLAMATVLEIFLDSDYEYKWKTTNFTQFSSGRYAYASQY